MVIGGFGVILRITHTGFLAYRVCCLQPGAPILGVGVRPAGEDQQGWGGGLVAGFLLGFAILCIFLYLG